MPRPRSVNVEDAAQELADQVSRPLNEGATHASLRNINTSSSGEASLKSYFSVGSETAKKIHDLATRKLQDSGFRLLPGSQRLTFCRPGDEGLVRLEKGGKRPNVFQEKRKDKSALEKQPAAQEKRTQNQSLPTTQHQTADEKKLLKKFEHWKEKRKLKKMLKEERRQKKKAKRRKRAKKLAGSSKPKARLKSKKEEDSCTSGSISSSSSCSSSCSSCSSSCSSSAVGVQGPVAEETSKSGTGPWKPPALQTPPSAISSSSAPAPQADAKDLHPGQPEGPVLETRRSALQSLSRGGAWPGSCRRPSEGVLNSAAHGTGVGVSPQWPAGSKASPAARWSALKAAKAFIMRRKVGTPATAKAKAKAKSAKLPGTKTSVRQIQRHLIRGSRTCWVPVSQVSFTQESCSDHFKDGTPTQHLLEKLLAGHCLPTERFLRLECVETSVGIASFNNRRLQVLKSFAKATRDDVKICCKAT
eukprot:s2811_g8.t1